MLWLLEIVEIAVDVCGLDGSNGVYYLLLHVWRPVGDELQKFFEFVRHGELVVVKIKVEFGLRHISAGLIVDRLEGAARKGGVGRHD